MSKFKKYFFLLLLGAGLSANAFAGKIVLAVDNKIQDFIGASSTPTNHEPKSFWVSVRLIDSNNTILPGTGVRGQSATSRMDKEMSVIDAPSDGLKISAIEFGISKTHNMQFKPCTLFGDYNKTIHEGLIKVNLTGDGKCYATFKYIN